MKSFIFNLCVCMAISTIYTSSVTLSIDPITVPFYKRINVTVQWTVSPADDISNDWISVWWVPFKSTYTEYQLVTSHVSSQTFSLLNARHNYVIRYFRGNTIMAQTEEISPQGSYPMQIHTQRLSGLNDGVQIIWNTNQTTGSEQIIFGSDPSDLSNIESTISSKTYTQQMLKDRVGMPNIEIASTIYPDISTHKLHCHHGTCYNDTTASMFYVHPGYFHTALLKGLTPGIKYYFKVGDKDGYMSDINYFVSPKLSTNDQVQILYVADAGVSYGTGPYAGSASHISIPAKYGYSEGGRKVWQAILNDPESVADDTVIMNGDISYARGWSWVWELFHDEVQKLFTRSPVIVTYGNHEYDYNHNQFNACRGGDSGGEAGIPTSYRFNLNIDTPWYTSRQGPLTIIALSSEHSMDVQGDWLDTQLQQVDRTVTPFVIVCMHRPVYDSAGSEYHVKKEMMKHFVPRFEQYNVDLVIQAHAHYYERLCRISGGECIKAGQSANWKPMRNIFIPMQQGVYMTPKTYDHDISYCQQQCISDPNCKATKSTTTHCIMVTIPLQQLYTSEGSSSSLHILQWSKGTGSVYVLDGTAGGSHTPHDSRYSTMTKYKDFNQWGYSRIKATKDSLTWIHKHIDGTVVDQVTIYPQQ